MSRRYTYVGVGVGAAISFINMYFGRHRDESVDLYRDISTPLYVIRMMNVSAIKGFFYGLLWPVSIAQLYWDFIFGNRTVVMWHFRPNPDKSVLPCDSLLYVFTVWAIGVGNLIMFF